MANDASNILPESYPMVAGDGDHSYAKNSSYQRRVADAAKEMISKAISDKLDMKSLGIDTSNTFQLEDLGCSTGPNSFIAVQNIIQAVEQKYRAEHQNSSSLEFQVYFNDHFGNDFNTLFKTLLPSRKYFVAGVPGSFHGRLFPKSTLHFAHSCYALHWLSKVPKEVVDSKSPAWNKGSIHCTGSVKEVVEAYSTQFKNDMESFLNARAQELVPEGLMVIVLPGLPSGIAMSETNEGQFYDFLRSCLVEVAKMGFFNEEKVEYFNIPFHYPTAKELQDIVQRNGYFSIERMGIVTDTLDPPPDSEFSAQSLTSQIRAIFEGVITQHFGNEFVDQIFNHFSTKLAEKFFTFGEIKDHDKVDLFILLKRIIN